MFTQEQALQTTREAPLVVIAHGYGAIGSPYIEQISNFEFLPVFVSDQRSLAQLSKAQVIGILTGKLTDWAELGEAKGPINLYLHGGSLQKQTLGKFLETLGITRADLRSSDLRYGAGYETLERISAKDPNAVVIGLRKLQPQGLKLVAIDGVSILDPATWESYPLRIKIHIYRLDSSEALLVYNDLKKEIDKRNTLAQYAAGAR